MERSAREWRLNHIGRYQMALPWLRESAHVIDTTDVAPQNIAHEIANQDSEALAHLCTVTGMSQRQAMTHVEDAFARWRARSLRTWSLDLTPLTTVDVILARPPNPSSRAPEAARPLRDLR